MLLVESSRAGVVSFFTQGSSLQTEHEKVTKLPGYQGEISSYEASQLLLGKAPGNYVIRWNSSIQRFACHIVLHGGHIEERPFSYDANSQCWRNAAPRVTWQDLSGVIKHVLAH